MIHFNYFNLNQMTGENEFDSDYEDDDSDRQLLTHSSPIIWRQRSPIIESSGYTGSSASIVDISKD